MLIIYPFTLYADPVQHYILDNGLKILVKEDHRAPIAVVMLWYNVGSADEPGGITGVSHVVEHMMFKGTAQYPAGIFSKTIAAIGGQENAMTNYDYTTYFEKIPAVQLPLAFELEADRMQNLLLKESEFSKEIKVIREERRLRTEDNPQALTFERYMAAAHLLEPYHHPIIGWMYDLYEMNLNDVKAWYQNFYSPNNASLIVVGDVDSAKVYDLAKLYFNKIPAHPSFQRKTQKEPPKLGSKTIIIQKEAKLPMLMVGYTVPSLKTARQDWEPYALEIIAGILNNGHSSRFSKNLIRGSRVASFAEVYYNFYARYQTQFIIYGSPLSPHSNEDLKRIFLKEILRLQNELVSDSELKRVKTQIIAQKTFEKDSIFTQAMEIGLLSILGLDKETADSYTGKIAKITPKQIQEVAKHYFNENAMTDARLLPKEVKKS